MNGKQQRVRIPAPHIHEFGITKWLQEPCPEEEVEIKNNGGRDRKFLPYNTVLKPKLDHLCPDTWDTRNFHHFIFFTPDRKIKVSGNIEVVVKYNYWLEDGSGFKEVYRTLAGAATFSAEEYPHNEHWGATVKSLCIGNAVQVLGRQFGWELNPDDYDMEGVDIPPGNKTQFLTRNGKPPVKMKPDQAIRMSFAKAVIDKDTKLIAELERIYDFNLTEPC